MTKKTRNRPGRKPDTTDFDALTQAQLALVHGKTTRTVINWEKEGLPRNEDGSYSAAKTIRWRISRDLAGGISYEGERARFMQARAEEMRGDLVALPLIEHSVSSLLSEVRTNILALPSQISPELEGQSTELRRATLVRAVFQLLDRLSGWSPQQAMKAPDAEAGKCGGVR